MNVVFMGTPEFARCPLEYLHRKTRHRIMAVVTGPDKKSGRGRKLVPTPVKTAAADLELPVFTPESLKDDKFLARIRRVDADIYVVVAFRILPPALYTIPPEGAINLHASLLPRYRGAAPINWALINGEKETGLTTFFLKKKVDTGNIIYQEKIGIDPDDTADDLAGRMAERAGPVIARTLDMIAEGYVTQISQDDRLATPAPKISPFDCLIDWGFPTENIVNFVRGMSSSPGAFTFYRGRQLKILRARRTGISPSADYRPGQVIGDKKRLLVATADGAAEIAEVLPEGKKKMTGSQFVQGYRPADGEQLGQPLRESNKENEKRNSD